MQLSRRTYLGAIGGSVLVAGCLGDDDDAGEDDTGEEGPGGGFGTADGPHELLVFSRGNTDGGNNHGASELTRLTAADGTYEVQASTSPSFSSWITGIDRIEDGYLVTEATSHRRADETVLATRDRDLDPIDSRELAGTHAACSDGKYIFSAHDAGLQTFDRDLELLGETTMAEGHQGKHMEAARYHDGRVYIVDNVVMPLYCFVVDVSEPTAPSYEEVLEVWGVNASLNQQWLEPEENRWGFLKREHHRMGGSQTAVLTPMTGARSSDRIVRPADSYDVRHESDIGATTVYEHWRPADEQEYEAHDGPIKDDEYLIDGFRIRDITAQPPLWAIIENPEERYLSSVTAEGDGGRGSTISFGQEHPLEMTGRVATDGDRVLAVTADAQLSQVDPAAGTIEHEQALALDEPLEIAVFGE